MKPWIESTAKSFIQQALCLIFLPVMALAEDSIPSIIVGPPIKVESQFPIPVEPVSETPTSPKPDSSNKIKLRKRSL
jgi:hypothetical protein